MIDTGYTVKTTAQAFISAFSKIMVLKLRNADIEFGRLIQHGLDVSHVSSPGHDILDENCRIELSGLLYFDRDYAVEMDGIAGYGLYIPQVRNVTTDLRMLSTDTVLVSDTWANGFLFFGGVGSGSGGSGESGGSIGSAEPVSGDVGICMTSRIATSLNEPYGSLLVDTIGGSEAIFQVYMNEPNLRERIDKRDAFNLRSRADVIITYNPTGATDFPVFPGST
jgi:hypothetical protein